MYSFRVLSIMLLLAASQTTRAQDEIQTEQHQKMGEIRQTLTARAAEVLATASDINNPGKLPPSSDVSFTDMEARWKKMAVQTKNHNFSTVINDKVLREMADSVGCDKIIGVMPTGFPQDIAHRQKLNGATLFARCGAESFAVFKASSISGTTGNRIIVSPESFNARMDGNAARQLFFKSDSGREKTVVSVLKDEYLFTMEYWSHDHSGKRPIASPVRTDSFSRAVSTKSLMKAE